MCPPQDRDLPSISVVVPVRNGETMIGGCVASLLAQQYPADRFEIIVVDNGSTDGTAQCVADCPVLLLRCPVPGASAARNVGVRHSTAEIVAFTDADCIADPGWLRGLAAAFEDASVGAAGGPIESFVHSGRNLVELFAEDARPLRNYCSGKGEFLPYLFGANAAYRREPLLAIGGWSEGLGTGHDVELAWRLQLRTGARIDYRPGAVIFHRHRSTWTALAHQYWTYGLGEVLLDSLFGAHPGYPRGRRFYRRRMRQQIGALPRYVAAGAIRGLRRARGRVSAYDAARPWLLLLAEGANLAGKIHGLRLSSGLSDPEPLRRYLEVAVPAHHLKRNGRAEAG